MQESLGCVKVKFRVSLLVFILSVFFGLLFSFISLLAFSFLVSLVGSVNGEVLAILVGVALAIGAFASGFAAAKGFKRKGLVVGAFSGALIFLVTSFIGFFFYSSGFGAYTVLRLFILLFFGAVGGITGVNKN